VHIVDNTGILVVKCIGISSAKQRSAKTLSLIKASVQKVLPTSKFKKGMLVDVLILSTKYPFNRKNGRSIKVFRNLGIILKEKLVPRGSRIRGISVHELRQSKFGRLAILLHRKL